MPALVLARHNGALITNPPTGDTFHLSTHGSDWLWALTAVYIVSLLALVGLTYVARAGERIFHYLFIVATFTGSIAYFAMASDLGSTPVVTSSNAAGTRQIFYARYINWFVSWTSLVIATSLLSGVSWATIVFNIALEWTWVASWLSGAVVATHYKWGFFAFGIFAYLLLAVSFLQLGRSSALRVGIWRDYATLSGYLVFLWLLYPIAWGVDEGGNEISVTSGFIFFGVLDFLTVPVLAFAYLALSRRWNYESLNMFFTQYGRVKQDTTFREKEPAVAPAATPAAGGVTNGTGAEPTPV